MNLFRGEIALKVLQAILVSVSPILISALGVMVGELRVAAKESANPWDDILVELLDNVLQSIAADRR